MRPIADLSILQINARFYEGGAATVARTLHNELRRSGAISNFAYGYGRHGLKSSLLPGDAEGVHRIGSFPVVAANRGLHSVLGIDSFTSPTCFVLSRLIRSADIIHLHVIHSHFISYRPLLTFLTRERKPVVWTAHDSWLLTGRCAISQTCDRWQQGCGSCPSRQNYPGSMLDLTRREAATKRRFIASMRDRLILVSPSEHLAKKLRLVFPSVRVIVINNGAHMTFNRCTDKPRDNGNRLPVILVTATDLSDSSKTNISFVQQLAESGLCRVRTIGAKSQIFGSNVDNVGPIRDRERMCSEYASADAVLFTSQIDNYPMTIVEALSCGTPVLAVPSDAANEILQRVDGHALSYDDIVEAIATRRFLAPFSCNTHTELRRLAAEQFSLTSMIDNYFDLYSQMA